MYAGGREDMQHGNTTVIYVVGIQVMWRMPVNIYRLVCIIIRSDF